MMRCFERFEAALRKAELGCVLCHLDFSDIGCYDTFWRGYGDGSLSDTLTQELITDDMRAAEGGADLYIHVRVLDFATEDGDFPSQDPSGTAGRGPPHPGPSREHSGQGPPAPGSNNHGDDTSPGYHGDGTGGQQVSGGDDVIQVKQEPAEQVPSCCMMGTVKSEMDTDEPEVKVESELDRQFAAIADHLGSMWERLASSLGFNTDYIRDLTARLPPSLRPHQLICDWMERNVGDVTLEQLVQALRDAGIHEVADAAASGQLFVTGEHCGAAKEKPDDDRDVTSPGPKPASSSSSEEESDNRNAKRDDDDERDLPDSASSDSEGDEHLVPEGKPFSDKYEQSDASVSSISAVYSSSGEEEPEFEVDPDFDDQLMLIANKLEDNWTWLALQLGFSSTDVGRISRSYPPNRQAKQCLGEWVQREQWGATLATLSMGLRTAGLHQIADEVETGSLFQKDVDDGSRGSKGKGRDDKVDGSSLDGDTNYALVTRSTSEVPENENLGPIAATMTCTSCKQTMNPEYSYICSGGKNCNLCVVCYKKKGHSHEMQWGLPSDVDTLEPTISKEEAEREANQRCMQTLIHACQCQDADCSQPNCSSMKSVAQHYKSCMRKTDGGCPICKQLIALCCYHAKRCQEQTCPAPYCLDIKLMLLSRSATIDIDESATKENMDTLLMTTPTGKVMHSTTLTTTARLSPQAGALANTVQVRNAPTSPGLTSTVSPIPVPRPNYFHTAGEESSNNRSPDDTDSETSGSKSGGSHGNEEGGAILGEDESTSENTASDSRTVRPSMYPTGEDALAWNDCIQDFFKTDEDTTRSIQESWPSNLLVKHLIRDRFLHIYLCEYWKEYQNCPDTLSEFVDFVAKACSRQLCSPINVSEEEFGTAFKSLCLVLGKTAYENESTNKQCLVHQSQLEWNDIHQSSLGLLQPASQGNDNTGSFQFVHDSIRQFLIAKWVVHMVTTNTEGEQQLRDFVKKSAALPLSCYFVAHLLGQSDSHRDHLLQFVNLLMQSDAELGAFDHMLHVVATTVESQQVDLLTSAVKSLFPEETLDLLSLPEISFHGLHSLTNFMSKSGAIRDIKLPSELKYKHLLKMYPFSKSKSAKSVSHYQQIRCLSCLPLFQTESRHAESLYFKRTDESLVVDHIQKYLLHCPLLAALTVQMKGVDINGLSKMAPYFLFAPFLSTLTLHNTKFSSSSLEDVKRNAQLVSARCLALCRDLNILNLTYFHIIDLPPLPNLEEIDLSHNSISDEVVSGLAEGFGSCQNLKKVNLSHNRLSGRGDFLPPLPNLEEIDLSHNAISDEAAPGLAECLGSCKKLKKVNLSHNKLSDRGDFLPPLPNLEEIDLSHNAISDEAAPGLPECLGSCKKLKKVNLSHNKLSDRGDFLPSLPNLEEIDLSYNSINDEAVPGLAAGLASCPNMRTVNLSDNNISNKGALMLLLEQLEQLQVDIRNNNDIFNDLWSLLTRRTDASQVTKLDLIQNESSWQDVSLPVTAVHLLLQFLPQLPNLQELALCVSCQGEEEAEHINQLYGVRHVLKKLKLMDWSLDNMIRLSTQMFQHLPLLEEIDLSRNAISDEAVPGLGKGLGSCQNLKKVNLRFNKLSDRGDVLPPLPNLEEIDLSDNAISDRAVPGLAEGLGSCQNLKNVDLSYNKLSDVRELTAAFIKLPVLTRVDIDYNLIRDESLPAIAAWLKVTTDVEIVDLEGNMFSAEGVRDFVRTMKGKAYRWGKLLYDGSQADVGGAVESGGEDERREEQQWGRLRKETEWMINVKFRQQTVRINHRGPRSNNPHSMSP
ncbi:uncharacterized protein LOC118408373 [Branchiostoma floridae]|uniref:Uncharacterized protein LOC118408373 n=1 Tax=Branchiostoma floridae TaxID=7739 RepID=A0A9J7HV78_BRAFL|nr:uncharacterized protein LOC118408373 [Branchiostoma floridae]